MTTEKDSGKINRARSARMGGAREGAGRPRGSTNKISAKTLLEEADRVIGKPFVTSLLEGYRDSILNEDTRTRVVYERMLLDKVASNLLDVEVTDSEDALAQRQAVFAEAVRQITGIRSDS